MLDHSAPVVLVPHELHGTHDHRAPLGDSNYDQVHIPEDIFMQCWIGLDQSFGMAAVCKRVV